MCGQRALSGDELTVRHAVRVVADDLFHLESKTLRSIGLLWRPGWLTREYIEGRRAPYTSPIKLYLACAAIFFLLAPWAGFTLGDIVAGDPAGDLASIVNSDMAARQMDRERYYERFDLRFQTAYTLSLAVSMLTGAGMLALLFRRQRRPFGAHVVFELHYISFLYVVTIVMGSLLTLLPPHPLGGMIAVLVVLGPYLYLALRRVYGEPHRRIAWKAAVMILFALVIDSLVSFLAVLVTMRLV